MSAVMERDLTQGLELVTGDEIALHATRHLFFAGDCLDPDRKHELSHLREGGEELSNRCLKRTGGFLPRCTITPMEFWGEALPIEHFPDGVQPYKLKDVEIKDENPTGRTLHGKPLLFMPMYPGHLIVDALGLATGERKGIVEIQVLKGVDYSPETERFNTLFFPATYTKPVELRLIQQRIEEVGDSHSDSDVKSIASDMVQSCEQFRRWAQDKIDKCHTQLDTRISHQWTYRYSPQVRALMRQLEIQPRNESAQQLNAAVLQAVSNSGISPEVFAQMQERDANLVNKLGEVFSEALSKALSSAKSNE